MAIRIHGSLDPANHTFDSWPFGKVWADSGKTSAPPDYIEIIMASEHFGTRYDTCQAQYDAAVAAKNPFAVAPDKKSMAALYLPFLYDALLNKAGYDTSRYSLAQMNIESFNFYLKNGATQDSALKMREEDINAMKALAQTLEPTLPSNGFAGKTSLLHAATPPSPTR